MTCHQQLPSAPECMHQQQHRRQQRAAPPSSSSSWQDQATLQASTGPSPAALQQVRTSRHWPWAQMQQRSSQASQGQQQHHASRATSAQAQQQVASQPQQQHLPAPLVAQAATASSSRQQAVAATGGHPGWLKWWRGQQQGWLQAWAAGRPCSRRGSTTCAVVVARLTQPGHQGQVSKLKALQHTAAGLR